MKMLPLKYIFIIFLISKIYSYETIDAYDLKTTSDVPDKSYNISKPVFSFSVDMIKYYSWWASFGYCSYNETLAGKCCSNNGLLENWEIISQGYLSNMKAFSYDWVLLKSDKYQKFIISVPGTRENAQLVMEAADSYLKSYERDPSKKIKLVNYFYDIYKKLEGDLFSAKNLEEINKHPDYQVIVTGHSLGGAVATIISFAIKYDKYFNNSLVLITFGQPRTGNYYFAEYVTSNVDHIFRIARQGDIVVSIPIHTAIMRHSNNYWHIGGLIVLSKDMDKFYKCDYDLYENGSDVCKYSIELNINSHTYYFNPKTTISSRCASS